MPSIAEDVGRATELLESGQLEDATRIMRRLSSEPTPVDRALASIVVNSAGKRVFRISLLHDCNARDIVDLKQLEPEVWRATAEYLGTQHAV